MPTNQFYPFCPTDTGTNLEDLTTYASDPNRTDGNQPGVASSKLNNRALRQANFITSQLAQYLSNQLSADVLDNGVSAQILAQIDAVLMPINPVVTRLTSSSGTFKRTFIFFIASGNATASAVYTDGTSNFTVTSTITGGTQLTTTGTGIPSFASGTLTKSSGTGDSTLTVYAFKQARLMRVTMAGGGGGGDASGSGSFGASATAGGNTTFGTNTAGGGGAANGNSGNGGQGGGGGTNTFAFGTALINETGGTGQGGNLLTSGAYWSGAIGGNSPLFGGGGVGQFTGGGFAGLANTGGGGAGGGSNNNAVGIGGGGGSGGVLQFLVSSPAATYSYGIGAGGSGGAGGATNGFAGGAGGSGIIIVEEMF